MAGRRGEGCWKWVVMAAVYTGIVILSASAFMAGILYVAILDKYNADKAKSSLIVSLNAGLLSLLGPFASIMVDRFSCRVSIVTGAILLTVSGVSSAFVNNLNWLLVTYGLIGGIGNSLVSVPYSITLGFYFDKNRDLVIALSTAVIGLGMFVASPIALYLTEHLSLGETFLVIGAINSHLCIVGIICRPSAREKAIHDKAKELEVNDLDTNDISSKYKSRTSYVIQRIGDVVKKTNFSILTNSSFLCFLISTLAWNVMLSICLLHLPNYASVLGATDGQITLLMTCFSVSNTSGRFLSALLVAKSSLDILVLHVATLVILGIVTVTYPLYSVFEAAKYVFAVVAGLLTGAPNSLMTPITLRIVGVENLSAAHGQEYFFSGIGFLAGPPIAGLLYEYTGSYSNSFIFAGCVNVLGGVLAVLARVTIKRSTAGKPAVHSVYKAADITVDINTADRLLHAS